MTKRRQLSEAEHAAVRAYAFEHGRRWKDRLRDDWMNARTTGILQALRNSHGPSWLVSYSIAGRQRPPADAPRTITVTADNGDIYEAIREGFNEPWTICVGRLPVPCRYPSGAGQGRGVPLGAPPLDTPHPPIKTERNERGQSVPLPLRAAMLKLLRLPFFRSLRIENSRNPARLVSHRPGAIDREKSARSAVHVVFQPQRRRAARPRPKRAAGERSRRRKPALPNSAVGFSGASWETTAG